MTGSLAGLTGRHAAAAFPAPGAAAMITGVIRPVDGGNLARNAGETIAG